MNTRVAVVGIGQMGGGMALTLARAGFGVTGYDVSAASRDAAAAQGVPVTSALREAVEGQDFVLSSLPNSRIARDAGSGKTASLRTTSVVPSA
jgi:3-hydroxyisobutyrate dehydrogenase